MMGVGNTIPIEKQYEMSHGLRKALMNAKGKPMYVTITYKEGDTLHHWQEIVRSFPPEDIMKSLIQLSKDAQKDMIKPDPLVNIRAQIKDRKNRARQRARRR